MKHTLKLVFFPNKDRGIEVGSPAEGYSYFYNGFEYSDYCFNEEIEMPAVDPATKRLVGITTICDLDCLEAARVLSEHYL
jgi:hypothetical protein